MKKITINGEIGWDVFPFMVQEQVDQAGKNEDLEVFISSPGGSVFKGIDIVDIFKNFKRDNPSSQMILHMGSIAASMGGFISASKVFDLVTAEDTTSHMRHNPIMGVFGDHREMESARIFLEGLTNMSSKIFADRSGQTVEKEKSDMNDETWLFGQEIVDAGFADEIMKTDSGSDKATSFSMAQMKFKEVKAKVLKSEIEPDEFSRVAAIVKTNEIKNIDDKSRPTIIVPDTTLINQQSTLPAIGGENKTQEVITVKDSNELKEKFPEIHAEVEMNGKKAGIDQEKERVKSLLEMKKKKDFDGIKLIHERIDEAIEKGESVQDVHTAINAMSMKGGAVAAALDTNDIGNINTVDPKATTSGEQGKPENDEKGVY